MELFHHTGIHALASGQSLVSQSPGHSLTDSLVSHSLQPYSALPYGADTLHFVVILAGLAYPAGCFYGMLVERRSVHLITGLTLVGTGLALYIVACALMSPHPPLMAPTTTARWYGSVGAILMIICWITFVAIASYAKTMITLWICDYNSSRGMFWLGMYTQFGAAIGALLVFALINYTDWFQQCPIVD